MGQKHYPASFQEKNFHCPHCNVYAQQVWTTLFAQTRDRLKRAVDYYTEPVWRCLCTHCSKVSYWHEYKHGLGRMVVPAESTAEPPHPDIPDACKAEYEEARAVFAPSPRASAALLRLVVQKLMGELGQTGKNLNDDIAALVSNGLPAEVQKMLDYCRVIGNHAVHPGEIDVSDAPEIAENLFRFINLIVEDRITRAKQIEKAYAKLPEGAREQIEKRDKT